jgi:iron complex transport system substrate-binding protein
MAKPEQQWETGLHRAFRLAPSELDERVRGQPRAEAFELRFEDASFRVSLGLDHQVTDRVALDRDEGLRHAISAWLVARGARRLALHDTRGQLLHVEELEPAQLGQSSNGRPARVVTLCPSAAELVHALGAFDRVIACEDSSDFPPELRSLERLGPDLDPDLDRVAELAPDLVVSSLSVPGMERVVTGLRRRGIPQFVSAPRSVAGVRAEMLALSELLGVGAAGEEALVRFDGEYEELCRARGEGERRRVFLEWWPRPIFSPGRDCYSNELIDLAGGVNVFGDRPGSSLEVSAAEVCAADPDIYFVSWCGVAKEKLDPSRVTRRAGFEELSAARRGAVFPVDEAFAGRPGPRMLEAARIMGRAIRGEGA